MPGVFTEPEVFSYIKDKPDLSKSKARKLFNRLTNTLLGPSKIRHAIETYREQEQQKKGTSPQRIQSLMRAVFAYTFPKSEMMHQYNPQQRLTEDLVYEGFVLSMRMTGIAFSVLGKAYLFMQYFSNGEDLAHSIRSTLSPNVSPAIMVVPAVIWALSRLMDTRYINRANYQRDQRQHDLINDSNQTLSDIVTHQEMMNYAEGLIDVAKEGADELNEIFATHAQQELREAEKNYFLSSQVPTEYVIAPASLYYLIQQLWSDTSNNERGQEKNKAEMEKIIKLIKQVWEKDTRGIEICPVLHRVRRVNGVVVSQRMLEIRCYPNKHKLLTRDRQSSVSIGDIIFTINAEGEWKIAEIRYRSLPARFKLKKT